MKVRAHTRKGKPVRAHSRALSGTGRGRTPRQSRRTTRRNVGARKRARPNTHENLVRDFNKKRRVKVATQQAAKNTRSATLKGSRSPKGGEVFGKGRGQYVSRGPDKSPRKLSQSQKDRQRDRSKANRRIVEGNLNMNRKAQGKKPKSLSGVRSSGKVWPPQKTLGGPQPISLEGPSPSMEKRKKKARKEAARMRSTGAPSPRKRKGRKKRK